MVFQWKWYCSTGVRPRGAQVRQRCGRWLNPLSSMKTIVRPSVWAFFNLWPALAFPPLDADFVAFQRPAGGSLHTPVQLAKDLPDMPGMIEDLKLLRDQIRHSVTSPQGCLIAQSLGTFFEQLR